MLGKMYLVSAEKIPAAQNHPPSALPKKKKKKK